MYFPADHVERSIPNLQQFIRANPLGVLTTAIPSTKYSLIQSTHIAWVIDVEDHANEKGLGRLRGHFARINPQARAIVDFLDQMDSTSTGHEKQSEPLEDVQVVFTHPVQHYVPPRFYVETMRTTRKQAPTWNFATVQVYGRARFFTNTEDPETMRFLTTQLQDLAYHGEVELMGHAKAGKFAPWQLSDAPESLINFLRKQIIGVEIQITRLEGKYKMSQELSDADREGVIRGFSQTGTHIGLAMAELVEERGRSMLRTRKTRDSTRQASILHRSLQNISKSGMMRIIGWLLLLLGSIAYLVARKGSFF